MMCLKEVHVFTFTNREALGRTIAKLQRDYRDKVPKGVIFKIDDFVFNTYHPALSESGYPVHRPTLDYKTLEHLVSMDYIKVESTKFKTWEEFLIAVTETKRDDDLFGKIEVEIR